MPLFWEEGGSRGGKFFLELNAMEISTNSAIMLSQRPTIALLLKTIVRSQGRASQRATSSIDNDPYTAIT